MLIATLCTATADAAQHKRIVRYAGPTVERALQIADETWRGPCAGERIRISWHESLAHFGAGEHVSGYATGADFSTGAARHVSCDIALSESLNADPFRRCDLIVHEAGHVAEHEHEEGGIMDTAVPGFAACRTLTRAQRRSNDLLALFPRSASVRCTAALRSCKVRARNTTSTYIVSRDLSSAVAA